MKKRLGVIPKGLEWISQSEDTPIISITKLATEISAKKGLQSHLIRATFIIKEEHLEKIKAYAYWERIQIKDVLEEMCDRFFQNKKVRSVPEKRKID